MYGTDATTNLIEKLARIKNMFHDAYSSGVFSVGVCVCVNVCHMNDAYA